MRKLGILGLAFLLLLFAFILPGCDSMRFIFTPEEEDPTEEPTPPPPPPPDQGGPVTRLNLFGLDPADGEENLVRSFEINNLRDGTEESPLFIGNVARGFTLRLTLTTTPTNATNPRVRWVEHDENIAIIDSSSTNNDEVIIRGVSNGFGNFHVESVANPALKIYFMAMVVDAVRPDTIVNPVFDFPIWSRPVLDNPNGLSSISYKTLGLARLSNEDMNTGTISVRLASYSGVPSNLNLTTTVSPTNLINSVRVEQISSNQMTGIAELQVTALAGTKGEVVTITIASALDNSIYLPVYLRIVEPFTAGNTLGISPVTAPLNTNPLTMFRGSPRQLRATLSNDFPESDATYRWEKSGIEASLATFNSETMNPVAFTVTSPSGDYFNYELEVMVTATDFFENDRTASITRFIVE